MTAIELTAPAKVNLFLKILNKRKDGYHNILTLFERITLADNIRISKIPKGIKISSDKFITSDPKDNLVYRAAELILKYKGADKGLRGKDKGLEGEYRGVKIRVEKRIPIAAGLGGGSSDAATTLIGINRLFNLKLKKSELIKLAKKLGADVPFFILNNPFAIGKSKGDDLRAIDLKIRLWHLIIYPGFKVATKDVYEAFDRQPNCLTNAPADVKIAPSLRHSMDLGELESMLYNDLQETVIAKKEAIGRVIERLAYSLDKKAIVSGSGPSVFCLCKTRKEAIKARKRLLESTPAAERKGWKIFATRTEV